MAADIKTLGTVASYINGRAFKPTEWEKEGLPIIRIQNLTGESAKYNYSATIHEDKYRVKNGDLLYAWSASLGAHVWNKGEAWLNQHIFKVIPNPDIDRDYLYYYLSKVTSELYSKAHGTGMVHITKKTFMETKIPVPPLVEQQRIVSRIEELFSSLDNAVETLQKTKEQLVVYRQAVLNLCIGMGDIKSISDCVREMGQGWSPKCIKTPVLNDEEWAVITTTAVQPMSFLFEENKKLPETLEARPKHELKEGDILITRAGPRSRCGVCCMVRKTKKRLMNCDKVYRLVVNKEMILPEYLEAVLNSPEFQKEIAFCKTGGNDSGVNLTQDRFLSIKIPVPTINEQVRVLSDIASRMSVYENIEQTIQSALVQAEAMRQSILKVAFEGRLA